MPEAPTMSNCIVRLYCMAMYRILWSLYYLLDIPGLKVHVDLDVVLTDLVPQLNVVFSIEHLPGLKPQFQCKCGLGNIP